MARAGQGRVPLEAIEYLARCHCGVLTARFRTALEPGSWSVRACQCSFCRGHGAETTSDPNGTLTFKSSNPARVQRYRFGGRTAEFFICRECGVYIGARIDTDKGSFGILNTRTLRPPLNSLPQAEAMDYGAESAEMRQLRRVGRWTPLSPQSL